MISRYISPMTIHHEGTTSRDRVKSNLLHRRDDATCIPVSFTYRDSRAKFSQTSPGVPFQYLLSKDIASRPSGSRSPPLCYTNFYYLLSISCRLLSPSPSGSPSGNAAWICHCIKYYIRIFWRNLHQLAASLAQW